MPDRIEDDGWRHRLEDVASDLLHKAAICDIVLKEISNQDIASRLAPDFKNYKIIALTPLQVCALDSAHNDLAGAAEKVDLILNPRD